MEGVQRLSPAATVNALMPNYAVGQQVSLWVLESFGRTWLLQRKAHASIISVELGG